MKKLKMETGVLVGIIAITINIITVTVYVYQTSIMQSQQHASVWPYLEWNAAYNQMDGFTLKVSNKGIGPALIKQVNMSIGGEEINTLDSLYMRVLGTTFFPHLEGSIDNRVLPAGQSVRLIVSTDPLWSEKFYYQLLEVPFEMEICYESIYGDQWTCKGVEVVESKCD
ncbi:MAG: hypothetical protein JXQ90_08530 [Cyclobacteriaceae bacterium]